MNDYISLNEAARHCNYSQDYLKLRARQGKFKAIKIGRNWVTTKEWVIEYAEKTKGRLAEEEKISRFSILKPAFMVIGLALMIFGVILFVDLGQVEYFLANIGSFVPSRVVEIR